MIQKCNLRMRWLVLLTSLFMMSISCKEQKAPSKTIAHSVELIKEGIQEKGLVSPEEAKGLNLLSQMMSGTAVDPDLVDKVQTYMDAANPSNLTKEIITVFDLVQTQGNISDADDKALQELVNMISLD